MATQKTQTIQDVLNSSGEQRDLMDLIVGAAVGNQDLSNDPEIVAQYDALSIEQKEIINFVVGAKISKIADLKHAMDVEEFLSHFGVKGMRWGIRNDDTGSGKPSSTATKSTGRRITNAVLGDKTYWKNLAVIGGVTGVGVAASFAAPAFIPASTLITIGQYAGGAAGLSGYATTASLATFGAQVVTAMGITASAVGGTSAAWVAYAANVGRAITNSQKAGAAQVNKTLDKKIKHSDLNSDSMDEAKDFIAHWGIKGMRWGVRRSDAELARLSGGQTEAGDAARARQTQAAIDKGKSLAAVDDADLNQLVNRINLEKRYVDAKDQASVLKKGHSTIKTVLNAGDTMNKAIQFANSGAGKIVAEALGLYNRGAGKHAGYPKNVIDIPGGKTYIGKHRK